MGCINSYIQNVTRNLKLLENSQSFKKIKSSKNSLLKNIKRINFDKKDIKLMDKKFKNKEIKTEINNLNIKKAVGLDRMDQQMFKNSVEISTIYLTSFFNYIFRNKKIPNIFNISKIIPIPKDNDNNVKIERIRPISLLSVVSKMLERLVLNRLNKLLDKHKIINNNQYGFCKHRRTEHNIMELYNKIFKTFHKKTNMIVVFLDFSKAYDTVNNKILIEILKKYGIKGKLFEYLKQFLSNRKSKICYNDKISPKVRLKYGLPQGSPLSPVLFNLYTNEIIKKINDVCFIRAFADDIVFYKQSDNITDLESKINKVTKKIHELCLSFNLYMSPTKCKFMLLTNKKTNVIPKIRLGKNTLEMVHQYKYLGIIFDDRLKFDTHIEESIKKAKKRMNIIKYISNGIKGCKISNIINMYKCFVRPIIEYGFSVLLNVTKSRLNKIESFQHICITRLLKINKRSSYVSLICTLNILNIKNRLVYLSINFIKKSIANDLNKLSMMKVKRKYNDKNVISFYNKACVEQKFSAIYHNYVLKYKKSEVKLELIKTQFNEFKNSKNHNINTQFFQSCFHYMITNNQYRIKKYLKLKNPIIHFYLKIMTGSFKLNYFLHYMNIKKDDKCDNCNSQETVVHKLYYCDKYKEPRKKYTNFKKNKK